MRGTAVVLLLTLVPLSGCLDWYGPDSEPVPEIRQQFQAIFRADPTPVAMDDCTTLLDTLNERVEREVMVSLHQSVEGHGGYWWRGGPMPMLEMTDDMAVADRAPSARQARAADAEVTGTNNQEAAADEADILKTDGEWTYVARQDGVYITHSENVGDVDLVGRIPLVDAWNAQLLLEDRDPADPDDDRLLVITRGDNVRDRLERDADARAGDSLVAEPIDYYPYRPTTSIQVYDVSNRSDPQLVRERIVEGDLSGARLIDGVAHVVVHAWADHLGLRTHAWPDDDDLKKRNLTYEGTWDMDEGEMRALRASIAQDAMAENRQVIATFTLEDHLPMVLRATADGLAPEPISEAACRRVLATPDGTGRGVTTVFSMDMEANALPHRIVQVMGSHPIVYGSGDALVLAEASQDIWWFWAQPSLDEATNLHWFDLDGLDVTHRASGRVDGIVQDQFGIDVHDDTLRVATTTGRWGRWWMPEPEPMANHLVVFENDGDRLVEAGKVSGIAPDERLWSARFTDDRAYLITFEEIDPLWVIDLSDASDPTILGELEIPGVSTYIHPLSDDALLTIGIGPRPDGQGLDWSRIQVSLFDISDPTDPTRADVLDVSPSNGWSWSGAVHEHKAFTYWDALGVLAVPITTNIHDGGYRDHHIGLRLIDVDQEAMDLSISGEVDQDALSLRDSWSNGIERSYFLGFPETGPVSVYALSQLGLTAHDLETLDLQDGVAFGSR